jgi:hypothetical protein
MMLGDKNNKNTRFFWFVESSQTMFYTHVLKVYIVYIIYTHVLKVYIVYINLYTHVLKVYIVYINDVLYSCFEGIHCIY